MRGTVTADGDAQGASSGAYGGASSSGAAYALEPVTELDAAAEHVGFFYLRLPNVADAAERLLSRCQEFHAQQRFPFFETIQR